MSLPQGINFRSTAGFVTDPPNYDYDNATRGIYPWTTAQGNNVGWSSQGTLQYRDRDSNNDARLAGSAFDESFVVFFRIDLPSAGNYRIGFAGGDANGPTACGYDLYDNTTNLGSLATGSTSAAQRFKDATNTEYTNVTWPTNQALVAKAFTSTILKVQMIAVLQAINSLYVESAAVEAEEGILMGDGLND